MHNDGLRNLEDAAEVEDPADNHKSFRQRGTSINSVVKEEHKKRNQKATEASYLFGK